MRIFIYGITQAGDSRLLWEGSPATINYRAIILDAARRDENIADFSIQRTCDNCGGDGSTQLDTEPRAALCYRCQGEGTIRADDLANGSMI